MQRLTGVVCGLLIVAAWGKTASADLGPIPPNFPGTSILVPSVLVIGLAGLMFSAAAAVSGWLLSSHRTSKQRMVRAGAAAAISMAAWCLFALWAARQHEASNKNRGSGGRKGPPDRIWESPPPPSSTASDAATP